MVAQNINSDTIALTGASNWQLSETDRGCSQMIVYNSDTVPVFIVTGTGTAPTAVFPTAGTPKQGKVIPPGAMMTFTKKVFHEFVAQATTGSGTTYISFGAGE